METENKAPEEEKDKKKADAAEEKKDEAPKEEKASEEKQTDNKSEDGQTEPEGKIEEEKVTEVSEPSETDRLKAENLTLKTQLEALKIGFKPDCLEDAVILAEAAVKRDGSDITAALQAVAKKYPEWKSDGKDEKSKGGFKIGADSPDDKKPDEGKLNNAFGIRKKKG